MAQGVHLHERCQRCGVPKVVGVGPLGYGWTGRRLHGNKLRLLTVGQPLPNEGEDHASVAAPATHAANDHVGVVVHLLELEEALLADDGLVHQNVVQDAAQGVVGVLTGGGVLHRLADGDAQAARRVGVLLQDITSCLGFLTGAGHYVGSPDLHHAAPIGFLLIADLYHVYLALNIEEAAGHGQGAAPLTRSGFGGDALNTFLLVVVGLGHRSVRFVATRRAHPLVLVVDLGRRIQGLLQAVSTVKGRRPPQLVDLLHLLWNVYGPLLAHLLGDDSHGKEGRQVLGANGLTGARMDNSRQGIGQVGLDIVPASRHLFFCQ